MRHARAPRHRPRSCARACAQRSPAQRRPRLRPVPPRVCLWILWARLLLQPCAIPVSSIGSGGSRLGDDRDLFAPALAGARVGAGALAAYRQAFAVAQTAIAAEVHEALDVHRDFAAQITLDRELGDVDAQRLDFGLGQVLDLGRWLDARHLANQARAAAANTVNALQADDGVLIRRDIDAGNAGSHGIPHSTPHFAARKRVILPEFAM